MPSVARPEATRSRRSEAAREGGEKPGRPGTDPVRDEELPAGGSPESPGVPEGPLVGHAEGPDGLHLVGHKLDAHRVRVDWHEHIDDATPDGEVAAGFHHVDAGVPRARERGCEGRKVEPTTRLSRQGDKVGESGDKGLDNRANRGDDNPKRRQPRFLPSGAGVNEAAKGGDAAAHGVDPGGKAFVGKRLPGGEEPDSLGVDVGPERGCEGLRFPSRCRHHQGDRGIWVQTVRIGGTGEGDESWRRGYRGHHPRQGRVEAFKRGVVLEEIQDRSQARLVGHVPVTPRCGSAAGRPLARPSARPRSPRSPRQ